MFGLFVLFTCLKFLSADSTRDVDWLVEKSAAVAEKGYVKTSNLSDVGAVVISHNDSPSDKSVQKASTKPKTENATLIEESGLGTGATLPTFTPTSNDTEPLSLCLNTTQQTRKLKPQELPSAVLNMMNCVLPKVFSQEWNDSDVPILLKEISEYESRLDVRLHPQDEDYWTTGILDKSFDKILKILQDIAFELGKKSEWYRFWDQLDKYISYATMELKSLEDIENGPSLVDWAKFTINSTHPISQVIMKAVTRNLHGSCRKKEDRTRDNSTFPFPSEPETEGGDNSSSCYEMIFTAFENLLSNKNLSSTFCSRFKTSPQQLLRQLHGELAIADARAYAKLQFSLMILHLFRVGDFTAESDKMKKGYERTLTEQEQVLKESAEGFSKWFVRCRAWTLEENTTFIQFTQVLQGYIVNEVDLNSKQSCRGQCEDYKAAGEFGCYDKTFCNSKNRCDTGKLYDCTFVEADSIVCLSSSKYRRYDWVKYKSGRVLGHEQRCTQGETTVNSWRRITSHCTYCVCLCDKPGPSSDRYVSLKPVVSNIHLGNIVTGVRFIKRDRVVHIQIKEGKALPRGEVNRSAVAWQEIQPVTLAYLNDTTTNNTEYATLSWHQRAIDLDHLEAPKDHVVTGLRFRRLDGHLNLQIQVTSIDFATGVMDPTSSIWIGNNSTLNSELARKELLLPDADSPLLSPSGYLQESGHNEYLQFQASSLEKDLGQTTIPLLDAQAVAPEPPLWLSGVALIHKGSPGNGGFISLKVATYDFKSHEAMPKDESKVPAKNLGM